MNSTPHHPPTAIAGPRPSKRPYTPPAIFCELELEIRAGSPFGIQDPFDALSPSE